MNKNKNRDDNSNLCCKSHNCLTAMLHSRQSACGLSWWAPDPGTQGLVSQFIPHRLFLKYWFMRGQWIRSQTQVTRRSRLAEGEESSEGQGLWHSFPPIYSAWYQVLGIWGWLWAEIRFPNSDGSITASRMSEESPASLPPPPILDNICVWRGQN